MARCNDCNKFVSYEEPDVTADDLTAEYEGPRSICVTTSVTITLRCGECGTDMRSITLDAEESVSVPDGQPDLTEGASINVDGKPEGTDRYEGKGRGMRHYYGFTLEAAITVTPEERDDAPEGEKTPAEWDTTVTLKEDAQASSFDEC